MTGLFLWSSSGTCSMSTYEWKFQYTFGIQEDLDALGWSAILLTGQTPPQAPGVHSHPDCSPDVKSLLAKRNQCPYREDCSED